MKIQRLSAGAAAVALALTWSLATAPGAAATTGNVEPHTQSHSHGVASRWDANWGSHAPYSGTFYYGDGAYTLISTSANSRQFSHTYYPCSGTTYTAKLHIKEYGAGYIDRTATTTEAGGNPC